MEKLKKNNKIININKDIEYDPDKTAIDIEHSKFFIQECQEMSDFIEKLGLTDEQNEKLIKRLVKHTNKMRLDGFIQCLTKQFKMVRIEE